MRRTVELPVEGMHCAGCARTIERALSARAGVSDATVNLAAASVSVTYDPGETDLSGLVSAVESAGYRVPGSRLEFEVRGMHCAACTRAVERAVRSVPGVIEASVNVTGRAVVHVVGTAPIGDLLAKAIRDAGYEAVFSDSPAAASAHRSGELRQRRLMILGVACTLPLLALSMAKDFGLLSGGRFFGWLLFALAAPVQAVVARDYYVGAALAIRNRVGTMDVLIAMGTSAAFALSVWHLLSHHDGHLYFETAAVIVTLVRVGKFLEARATRATGDAIRGLNELRPSRATVVRGADTVEVPVEAVVRGDVVLVKPGQRIPVDGTVVDGESAVDESMLTGESMPVDKTAGASVSAGTLNVDGLLRVRVDRVGPESLLAQIIRIVQEAQGKKAPIQRVADRVAAVFVPAVLAVACLAFVGWVTVGGLSWSQGLIRAIAVLVIACPCALGLATPTAVVVGSGRAARMGVLFRSAEVLERTASVDTVVFDKTGTLTVGRPKVVEVVAFSEGDQGQAEVVSLAASAERGSDHPIARAVTAEAHARHVPLNEPEGFLSRSGLGVEATVGGRRISVGRPPETMPAVARDALARMLDGGATVVAVAVDGVLAGLIGVADVPREEARDAVRAAHGLGLRTVMLSGDHEATARAIGRSVGIDQVEAGLLPEGKAAVVRALRAKGDRVLMVGDGINDAPALAEADVGMAIGSGTDIALETADIALLGDLHAVPVAVDLARRTMRTIRQNLFWAFVYNIVLIPAAAAGLLHPMLAAAAMAASSVLVVTNSLRLRSFAPAGVRPQAHGRV